MKIFVSGMWAFELGQRTLFHILSVNSNFSGIENVRYSDSKIGDPMPN